MTNREISYIFSRIADALEIRGENVFRIRAYRVAARNITNLSRQLGDIHTEDPSLIDNIPGIGKDLRSKITELIDTGHLEYFNDLMKEFPDGFLDLLSISGLGPKKLKRLKEELGVNNVDELEDACKRDRLSSLEGMGKKTQDKILDAIGHFRKSAGRMLLADADRFSKDMIEYLASSGMFKKLEKAGSLRRGRETVGDIDILALTKDTERAMDHFISYPGKESEIARGTTKSSISVRGGPRVDLRVVESGCFGAALVYFTGSKQHNVKIRMIAKKKGYKVNEYGVFSVSPAGKEKIIAGRTEKEVYESLGIQWIPPELREDAGEVEAGLEGRVPRGLVKTSDIRGDLHLHTDETDGRSSLEELASKAVEKGYEYIAVTDHSKLVKVARGLNEKEILAHAERIRRLDGKSGKLRILAGVEVDLLEDGSLDLEDDALKEMDIVIAAIHSKFSLDKKRQTERILRGMDNRYVNVLAHPSGRLITARKGLQVDFDMVFSAAAERGVFLEINTHGERIDLNDVNSRRAKELGAGFVINTDAHETVQMDLMTYGVTTARRGWLEKKDVLNTYSEEKLIKALNNRK